jgi:lipoprotein-releasing system permease protein
MYIYMLWMRYLKARRQAYICIICVMLGVATLIVVNSVMSGFSTKLRQSMHNLQSDIVVESTDQIYGFPDTAESMMATIQRSAAAPHIRAMAPSVELFALMQYRVNGRAWTQRIRLVGIDPKYQRNLDGFTEYLMQEDRKANPSFELDPIAAKRYDWFHPPLRPDEVGMIPNQPPAPLVADQMIPLPPIKDENGPPLKKLEELPPIDNTPLVIQQPRGAILGSALASRRISATPSEAAHDSFFLDRGDTVAVYTIGCEGFEPVWDEFVVCDYIQTGMSDFDSSTVFVPLDRLQRIRTMEGRVNTIQIRLNDQTQMNHVKEVLQNLFPPQYVYVSTWEEKQGVLLAAIAIERGILNLLLFLIIGVAGFGILAIFSMIVTEKTRDIGILKSLGASGRGIWSIFLGYGLLLGLVGAGMGTALGLLITRNINEIEGWIGRQTGRELFSRDVYYFKEIPTNVNTQHVFLIIAGAVLIAVVFSILPARKAARLKPVQALRFE